jgi:NitT/TauT family transport system substrate-binding protein
MRHSIKRGITVASIAAITAITLGACSSGGATPEASSGDFEPITSVKLQLQWLPQAQFAGYYVALDKGYFQEEGFDDVELIPSGGDIVPQDALAAGDVDFAVAWVPKVLGTLEATGAELTDIAQVFQKSGTLQVSFKGDGVSEVADFEGKRIGSWGFGNEWEIFAAMAADDLDASTVSITTQDFSMNALIDGDVDAAQAMTYNEYAQILETVNPATGKLYQPEDFDVVSYEDTDGAMLQDAIWADTARLDDPAYADAAVRFLKAVTKGWLFARDNPEDAAAITYDAAINAEAAFPVGPVHQQWQMNEVNKLIWTGSDFGTIDKAAWDKTVKGALAAVNQDGLNLITEEPADTA